LMSIRSIAPSFAKYQSTMGRVLSSLLSPVPFI
jgi:hypothetical protein